MNQQVDPSRIMELSDKLKRLNQTVEGHETYIYNNIRNMLSDTRYAYPESYVQSAVRDTEQLLLEIHNLAQSISDRLDGKSSTLKHAAETYAEVEQRTKLLLSKPVAITWSGKTGFWGNSKGVVLRSSAASNDQANPSSLFDALKRLFQQAKNKLLAARLMPFQEDSHIAGLLGQLKQGTPEEQKQAATQLEHILSQIQGIARSQVAYGVYSQYGNSRYMEEMHQQAEAYRAKLRALGISEEVLAASLAANYMCSPLSACSYDPRLSDGTAMPVALWNSGDGKLPEDQQIALLQLTDHYFKASTKEQREEILQMAEAIRDGSLSTYPLLGNKLDTANISAMVQSLVNSKEVFGEMIQSIEHDSKFAVFANANLTYHEQAVSQAMRKLNETLAEAESGYWNSERYAEPNWWLDAAKLAEAVVMLQRDARNGGLSLPEMSGNQMAAIQYILGVPVTKEWGMDTLNTLEAAMTQQGVEGDAHVLGEESVNAIVKRYTEKQTAPGVLWGEVAVGVLQTVGGGFEAAFGVGFGIATSETLIGGLYGAYVATHGASNVSGGISRLWNGLNGSHAGDTANFEKNLFRAIGGETGAQIYNGIDAAMALAQPVEIVSKMIYKAPNAAIEAYQAEKAVSKVGGVVEGVGQGKAANHLDDLLRSRGFTSEELDNLIQHVNEEVLVLKNLGLTKKELGAAVSGVYNRKTGQFYTAINNMDGSLPTELHPLIESKIKDMPKDIREGYIKTHGSGSHAEVYSVNKALLDGANPEDIMGYVVKSGGTVKPIGDPFPMCPHCSYILQDFFIVTN